jgi:hypothetical protein
MSSPANAEQHPERDEEIALLRKRFFSRTTKFPRHLLTFTLLLKLSNAAVRFPKKFARNACEIGFHDFRTTTSRNFHVIFFLTSFFINSIHQLVAVEDRCKFSMKNGRENRNMATKKKAKKKKKH